MEINLSEQAVKWFENDFPLDEGEAIRFFGKTYGQTEAHEGFSLGMELADPEKTENILASTEINKRIYFISSEDDWFFNGYDLVVRIDDIHQEPSYHFNPKD